VISIVSLSMSPRRLKMNAVRPRGGPHFGFELGSRYLGAPPELLEVAPDSMSTNTQRRCCGGLIAPIGIEFIFNVNRQSHTVGL